jgi:hypothetical protein
VARGRIPKDVLSRPRDTRRREAETVAIADTGELAGPELPSGVLPDGEAWHPRTVALWDSLRRYPPMKDEPALSWVYLVDTMLLHHRLWQHSEWQHAGEIRLRLAKMACTPEDRQRIKVKITRHVEAPEVPAGVADIASRRARLTDS